MKSLKEAYQNYFLIGAEVNTETIVTHRALLQQHFNSITCENEMKPENVWQDGAYTFAEADRMVQFAKENELAVRGHTLVWHNQTPEAFFADASREALVARMESHIEAMARQYGDACYAWDVVNEAVNDKDGERLRKSRWQQGIGDDYLDIAFRKARECFPKASLFYNDYNESNPEKRERIYETLKGMKERGVPLDGMGLQCHAGLHYPTEDELRRAIERYASLGLVLHVTELDVTCHDPADREAHGQTAPTAEQIEAQAKQYAMLFRVFREYREHIASVTLWGVADDRTWLDNFPVPGRKNWPLLFDERHEPKEAFYRILQF